MKFLIVKPSSLGDVLHAMPAVNALCRETNAEADWVIQPAFADLVRYVPGVRRAIFFDRRKMGRFWSFLPTWWRFRREVRREKYDAVIDLQGLFRSAWLGSMARAKVHAGLPTVKEKGSAIFYSRKLSADPTHHAVLRNNEAIADFLGKKDIDFSFDMPEPEDFAASAVEVLLGEGVPPKIPLIGIAPGARWDTKRWPPTFFAELINRLQERIPDTGFLLLGADCDRVIAQHIHAKVLRPENVFSLCGKTSLHQLVEVTRHCSLFISNDSGPMHIAAALHLPILALFGATSPELTGPYAERKEILMPKLDCVRCFKRRCPHMTCHTSIDPATAAEAAVRLLTKGPEK